MGLLKLATDTPGIDFYDYRDSDYYGKYKYRVRFSIEGVRYAMYEKNFDGLMKRYNAITGWKKIKDADRPVVTDNLEALGKFIDFRNMLKENNTGLVRVESNRISIFSNDLALLRTSESIKNGIFYDYTESQTNNFVGIKSFVNDPKHKYRVYLKSKMIQESFVTQLADLFKRSNELYPSPSLKYWLQGYNNTAPSWSWRYRYTNCNHFIDYDDESTLSYLALMHGEFLGKRYKLEKRPEAI
jgi:hypothetical protein